MNRTKTRRSRRASTPSLDQLESRQLLNAAPHHHHGAPITKVPADISVHLRLMDHATVNRRTTSDAAPLAMAVALSGSVQGTIPILGLEIELNGSGTVRPLGAVTSRGFLAASGAEPVKYSGTVTLVGLTGSVTLDLSGQQFGANQFGQRIRLTYTITRGTGAFLGAGGSGQASLAVNVSGAGESFVLTFGDTANPITKP
jgi:hypothetical protein